MSDCKLRPFNTDIRSDWPDELLALKVHFSLLPLQTSTTCRKEELDLFIITNSLPAYPKMNLPYHSNLGKIQTIINNILSCNKDWFNGNTFDLSFFIIT